MKPRAWLFLGLAFAVAATCVRLGIWQLARFEERRGRNAEIRAGLKQPPMDITATLASETPPLYQRVTLSGQLDSEHEIVLTARTLNGQPGVHLVTPLIPPNGGGAVLINRGWIPAETRKLPERRRYERSGEVTLEGITKPSVSSPSFFFLGERPTPSLGQPIQGWRTVEISAIEAQMPYPLAGFYVALEEPIGAAGEPPIPQPEIDLSEGPHLGYAIQWFSFAAIALGGGGTWFWRRRG